MPSVKKYPIAWRQKMAILIRMQFLNDIIKSRHGFKTAQKFYKFRVFIKTQNISEFILNGFAFKWVKTIFILISVVFLNKI